MRYALMLAAMFIIATVAVAFLEPLAPTLPDAPAAPEDQVAAAGDTPEEDVEDYSKRQTARPGAFDEAAQDRGK